MSEILKTSRLDYHDPAYHNLLSNMQANILKHHGREHAWHIFLRFNIDQQISKEKEDAIAAIKSWIKRYADKVTNARTQLKDTEIHHTYDSYDGGTIICFFLAAKAYASLNLPSPKSEERPFPKMEDKQEALSDPLSNDWEEKFRNTDAMILLADMSREKLQKEYDYITETGKHLFSSIDLQKGVMLRDDEGRGIEHFGYVDGISQPVFLKGEKDPGEIWDDNSSLDLILVPESILYHEDCYGSFFVFRKLEQNVRGFKMMEEALQKKLFPLLAENQAMQEELAGAYLVGRFRSGNPVLKQPEEEMINREKQFDNDFDYWPDKEGSKCPYHAHIRLTNPRNDVDKKIFTRIVRRGIPYDEAGRNNDLKWYPTGDVGLLFMSYQSNLKQFEKIQREWSNNGSIGFRNTGIDPVSGQGENANNQEWPLGWGKSDRLTDFKFSGFVTMKGGEYFFAPSIPFLKNIDKLSI